MNHSRSQSEIVRFNTMAGSCRKLPPTCQKMLFSATYDDDVMRFAEKLIPDATILRLKREEESLDNIKQFYIECKDSNEKYRAIANIYGAITIGQAMIFCQVRTFFAC